MSPKSQQHSTESPFPLGFIRTPEVIIERTLSETVLKITDDMGAIVLQG